MADPELRELDITEEDAAASDSDCSSVFDDDSDEDPSFDLASETRSRLSNISLKKSGSRDTRETDSDSGGGEEATEVVIPELNEKDGKCFEHVLELIKGGHLEKLKVEQCKVYLRKYGLRLTGVRSVLIDRIKEHLEIINGGGEKKYPVSSFVVNCKGDACTGDVVMFEQNVYEMFNIASRSATGPPCGTRVVVGRIVKESYGAAKQQHTFTIEVFWSKGEKPLPPLHPLLIKGRNLYRLKTMRQKWADEEERRKILLEKHSRGHVARCSRETRIKEKEKRKADSKKSTKKRSSSNGANPVQTKVVQQQDLRRHQDIRKQQQNKETDIVLIRNEGHHQVNPIHPSISRHQNFQEHEFNHQPMADMAILRHITNHQHTAKMIQNQVVQHNIQHQQHLQGLRGKVLRPEDKFSTSYVKPLTAIQSDCAAYILKPNNSQGPQRTYCNGADGGYQPHQTSMHSFHQRQPLSSSSHQIGSPLRQHSTGQPRLWCPYYPQGRCYFGENCRYRHR